MADETVDLNQTVEENENATAEKKKGKGVRDGPKIIRTRGQKISDAKSEMYQNQFAG